MPTPSIPPDFPVNPGRREILRALGGSALFAGLPLASASTQAAPIASSAHIVIVGSGLGGLAVAHRLSRALEGAKLTIIDAKRMHNYQPGYTLVATGIWPVDKVVDDNAALMPDGVNWIQEAVTAFEPEQNTVQTQSGQRVRYDFLVVATGLQLDYGQIEGMDVRAIGQNGLASVYYSHEAAAASWQALDSFRQQGGRAVMTLPHTPLKCAGAPLKMTFMVADRLREANTLAKSNVSFYSALKDSIFSVKPVNDNVISRWEALGVPVHFQHRLSAVDLAARKAVFTVENQGVLSVDYDFLHVVPPMRAPDAVKNSPLALQQGPLAAGGWLDVDKHTLQHRRYANVFGIGDINGTPRGKTAATIKKSAPLVVHNLLQQITGKVPDQKFDGYTSCPLLIREGSALLVEFDYEGRLIPSLPFIEPLQDSYLAWLLKYRMLKPAYLSVLKGRV